MSTPARTTFDSSSAADRPIAVSLRIIWIAGSLLILSIAYFSWRYFIHPVAGRNVSYPQSSESNRADAGLDAQSLGITVEPLNADLVTRNKLGRDQGVLVSDVQPNSPGTDADLRTGDVILVFGNRVISSRSDFEEAAKSMRSGTRKPIEVVRDGIRMTLTLKIDRPR